MKELVDKLPKGVKAWRHYLHKLTASDITWNYHWFPASEVIVMSSYRPFFVLESEALRIPTIHTLRVPRQLGQRQILPRARGYRESFDMGGVVEDRDRESRSSKIWGGSRTLSSKAMKDQCENFGDREEEIEVENQASSTSRWKEIIGLLGYPRNDLKNAREELAQRVMQY
ncbi:hypothetical protein H5410_059793 [Solanum commersonii]|uniref:Uncharacterized protein n=1 Tax=Solanum commersonii TaxID=4109 RepID=A0A9J5W3B9_SOLCO|nr:hypothetical protein H5410_059793 [Solanum commersonii]